MCGVEMNLEIYEGLLVENGLRIDPPKCLKMGWAFL